MVGQISANGVAVGNLGGILSLSSCYFSSLMREEKPDCLGLMLPEMVVEKKMPNSKGNFRQSMRQLQTLQGLIKRPSLFAFMGAQMFYRDALNALYTFGGIYAWIGSKPSLGCLEFLVACQQLFVVGSQKYDRKLGPLPVIYFHLALIIVSISIIGMSRSSFFGLELAEGSSFPDILFYIFGAAIGGSGGGIYAASRSMMVRHTNPKRPAEAFGLFSLSGKVSAFLAPLLIGIFTYWLNDIRLGFTPIVGLFILGWVLSGLNQMLR